jgi:7,8-dihydroneopterin aldolase/epimerase/oxygenase
VNYLAGPSDPRIPTRRVRREFDTPPGRNVHSAVLEVGLSDRIFIEGIKFHGYHGLTRLERQIGVRLAVDIALDVDLSRSGRSDRVGDTVDYRKIHARVLEVGRGKSHKLLESFALTLMNSLFGEFPAERIVVRVRKETPVLDGIVDSVGVELSRTREELVGR